LQVAHKESSNNVECKYEPDFLKVEREQEKERERNETYTEVKFSSSNKNTNELCVWV